MAENEAYVKPSVVFYRLTLTARIRESEFKCISV